MTVEAMAAESGLPSNQPLNDQSAYTEYKGQIHEICGDRQFMGVSHGCEIVAYLVHHQLEMDHAKVVIKVDDKNAFNEIDPTAIINVVHDELPAILSERAGLDEWKVRCPCQRMHC